MTTQSILVESRQYILHVQRFCLLLEAACGCRTCPRYMILHTFFHVARVRKHMDMRELHAFRAQFSHVRVFSDCFACNSRMSVCFLTRATCKNVLQNLVPRATAESDPSHPSSQACTAITVTASASAVGLKNKDFTSFRVFESGYCLYIL